MKGIYEERRIAVLSGWVAIDVLETLERLSEVFIHGFGVFSL